MKPPPFRYERPTTIDEAIELLTEANGDGKALAGGQSLVPLLSMRLARPTVLVDLNHVESLTATSHDAHGSLFGAMTRQRELIAQTDHALLATAAGWIGHAAIRSRGTIGGSLAHADPSAELPAVAMATDAVIEAVGASGTRSIDAADFFEGMLETALCDGELLATVRFSTTKRWGFAEMARRHGDFALVLAVVAELNTGWRVVIGGVGPTPYRCRAAEAHLNDLDTDNPTAVGDHVAAAVADSVETFDDVHASANYRQAMAAHLTAQAVGQALEGSRKASS